MEAEMGTVEQQSSVVQPQAMILQVSTPEAPAKKVDKRTKAWKTQSRNQRKAPQTVFHVKQPTNEDGTGPLLVGSVPRGSSASHQEAKQWVLRYKWGNHPAETGTILASTRERAEEVGRAWCLKKGAGQMQGVRFIGVEDPVLADESILENAT